MSNEPIIDLDSGDGQTCRCRLIEVFSLDEKQYALLVELESSNTVMMEFIEQGDQATFRTIESDEEFERVTAFVRALAEDARGDEE